MSASETMNQFIEGQPDTHLQCRDFGHQWRPFRAYALADAVGYRRVLACMRCGAERSQDITLRGSVLSAGYAYPSGYRSPRGMGRMTLAHRDFLRLESTLRLTKTRGIEHAEPKQPVIKVAATRRAVKRSA